MTTAFQLQSPYYEDIGKIQKDPRDLAIKALELASVISEHMDGHPALKSQVITALSRNMIESFIRIPPKELGPMDVIRMLEDVYGAGGPFADYPVIVSMVRDNAPTWIAAIHYLQSIGEKSVEKINRSTISATIAWIAFEGGRNWKSLQKALNEVDAGCGTNFLAEVPDMLENAHHHFSGDSAAARIQEMGGLARVKAVGANLGELARAVMSGLPTTDLNHKGFPLMYAFIKDATLDLMASGAMSKEEGSGRFTCLFDATLHALSRQINHKHDCWIPILQELSRFAGAGLSQVGLVNLGIYLDAKAVELKGFSLKDMARDDDFKRAVKKVVYAGDQYDFVQKHEVMDHFTQKELMMMRGSKLKDDLGL